MSDETVVERKTKQGSQISLGVEDLQALIATSVSEAVKQAGKSFADAMLEARKPYIDPRVQQNEDTMRKSMREATERINLEIEASKETCPHVQGSNALSEFQGPMGSFVLHQLDTGVTVGICTNCQKVIWSNEEWLSAHPDDRKWFQRKNANRMSRAGQRQFRDPTKAQACR